MALPNAPQSRNEKYLAKIAGQEVELPNEPLSREEQYLEYIATHGGGGGSSLEAGNYIEIDANDKINVKMEKGDATEYEYRLTGAYIPINQLTIEKYRDGELISTESYENVDAYTPIDIDGLIEIWYSPDYPRYYWHYKLLEDSREHSTNYEDSWYYTDTTTRTEIFDIEDSSLTLVRNCDLAPVAKSGNYSDLNGNPSINGVILSGNKTAGDLGLQGELTFDNVPTDGSNNPVKSDGIYDSEKDIYAVMGKMGAKNLNSYPYVDTTKTTNGITFTDNGDGTITANGTATADAYFNCHSRAQEEANDLIIPNGRYIFTGCPSGGSTSTYRVAVQRTYNGRVDELGIDSGDGVLFVANGDDFSANEVNLQINISIKKGQTVSNLTFKPMLRLASDTDYTYQPYAKTNRELTDEIATKTKNFQGTIAEWNQLTTAEKKAYDHASIPDSLDGNVTFPASKVMLNSGDSVEDIIDGNHGAKLPVNITAYNSTNNYYTCPSNGWAVITGYANSRMAIILDDGSNWYSVLTLSATDQTLSIYVPKGTKIAAWGSAQGTSIVLFRFMPLT